VHPVSLLERLAPSQGANEQTALNFIDNGVGKLLVRGRDVAVSVAQLSRRRRTALGLVFWVWLG